MLLKWTLAFLAAAGAFTISGVAGALITDALGLWSIPGAGFSAACAVVVVAYVSAPSHKFIVAASTFIAGATAAWLLLEPSFYPESYGSRRAYQPTHLPVAATYAGGLLGLFVSACIRRWAGPNNSSKPTLLHYGNGGTEKRATVASTTQCGLTQVLGRACQCGRSRQQKPRWPAVVPGRRAGHILPLPRVLLRLVTHAQASTRQHPAGHSAGG
jgi:hypothetical protein